MVVLLADDSEMTLEIQRLMLESSGVSVEAVSGGRRAVETAGKSHFSMIFLSIRMEEMDGFSTAAEIRAFDKKVPIIGLSTEPIAGDDAAFAASGMNGILQKPLQFSAVRQVLAEYLHIQPKSVFHWRRERDILFDYENLCEMVGDMNAVQNILFRFLTIHGTDCGRIREHIKQGEYEAASKMLYDIIGFAGNIRCLRLYDTASLLIAGLKCGNAEKLPIFVNVWNDTIGTLSEHCSRLIHENRTPEPEPKSWAALISEFIAHVGEFDAAATDLFNAYNDMFAEHFPKALFKNVKYHVDRYEYLEVRELMEAYQDV